MRAAAFSFLRLCAFAKAFSSVRKNLGLSICSPVESVANAASPTSIPYGQPEKQYLKTHESASLIYIETPECA